MADEPSANDLHSALTLLVNNSAAAILIVDCKHRIQFANPAAEAMFGHCRGRTVADVLGLDVQGLRSEEILVHREGAEPLWVEIMPTQTTWKDQPALVATVRDITERKRGEQKLRESEERYHQLADNCTDLISRHDSEGTILYASPVAWEYLGYDVEELVGRPMLGLVHPEDFNDVRSLFSEISEEPQSRTYRIRHRDGHYLWFETTAKRFGDDLIAVSRDVTRRKEMDQHLRHVQKMQAVSRLAGGVAHDFNNLLTAITGYAELALRRIGEKDAARSDVEQIKRAADRATSLTRQLLSFSRKHVMHSRVVNINDVIRQITEMLRNLVGAGVQLVLDLNERSGSVCVDPVQIEQVILNLVVNARDAMPHGGRLTIRTGPARLYFPLDEAEVTERDDVGRRAEDFVLLSVSDTGVGIPPQHQGQIFEPFFTTKPPDEGTGLGLSTVYGIVQQSGGRVTFDSAPHSGTTFRVYLPAGSRAESASFSPVEDEPATRTEGKTFSILVVEDLPIVRSLVRRVLRAARYDVLEAMDARTALTILEQHSLQIDLLVTDVVMPDMNGPQLAARAQAIYPELKVLYMSGYTDGVMQELTGTSPGASFLQKPFTGAQLCAMVERVLREPQRQQNPMDVIEKNLTDRTCQTDDSDDSESRRPQQEMQ